MASRVKCGRCEQSFSAQRNRCPHCGAERSRAGKRVADTGDKMARRAIKIVLLLALVIATVSVIALNLDDEDGTSANRPSTNNVQENAPSDNGDEPDETNGLNIANLIPDFPEPEPTPEGIAATSVTIDWATRAGNATDFTLSVGNELVLRALVFPVETTDVVTWEIAESTVANITIDPQDLSRVTLVARGSGVTTLRATAGEHTAAVTVRVN